MNEQSKPEWAMSNRERINVERAAQGLPPKRRKWPYVLLALIVIGAGAGYYMTQQAQQMMPVVVENPEEQFRERAMQLTPSEVAEIQPLTLRETLKVTGTLAPRHQVQIASETAGRVASIHAWPGDSVAAGTLLVQLDVETLELQLAQQRSTAEATRSQLALAEQQLERTMSLAERGLTSDAVVEQGNANVNQLRSSLAAQQAMVESAEYSLSHAAIRAPFDGIVSARMVEPGQFVGGGTPVMTVVDLSSLEFVASAPVNSSARIATGQTVVINIDGQVSRIFQGTVERINPVTLDGSRSLPVYIAIDNADGLLRGGMFATGQIIFRALEGAIAVPPDALREDLQGPYVLKLEGDKLVRQPVTRGAYWNGSEMIEIEEGLAPGDRIVRAALVQLNPGDTFELVDP